MLHKKVSQESLGLLRPNGRRNTFLCLPLRYVGGVQNIFIESVFLLFFQVDGSGITHKWIIAQGFKANEAVRPSNTHILINAMEKVDNGDPQQRQRGHALWLEEANLWKEEFEGVCSLPCFPLRAKKATLLDQWVKDQVICLRLWTISLLQQTKRLWIILLLP